MLPILILATASHLLVTTNYNVDGALTVGYEPNELHYATVTSVTQHFLNNNILLFSFQATYSFLTLQGSAYPLDRLLEM